LTSLFDAVIAADDVTEEKPAVEPFEKAMQLLGATADETIMVGDNDTDILGGKNAGLKTVAVGWAIKGRAYLEASRRRDRRKTSGRTVRKSDAVAWGNGRRDDHGR